MLVQPWWTHCVVEFSLVRIPERAERSESHANEGTLQNWDPVPNLGRDDDTTLEMPGGLVRVR